MGPKMYAVRNQGRRCVCSRQSDRRNGAADRPIRRDDQSA